MCINTCVRFGQISIAAEPWTWAQKGVPVFSALGFLSTLHRYYRTTPLENSIP